MSRLLLLLFLSLLFESLAAQNVTLQGIAKDYAGKEIRFYCYPEPISHQPKMLAESTVHPDGTFLLAFKLDQSIEIYADLEKFRGTLVAEPGANYQIGLPPYSPRTPREAASPYFEPDLYWLDINGLQSSDLNFRTRKFLTEYNNELSRHTLDLYQKKSTDTLKSILARLDRNNPTGKDHYLNVLKICNYGELEYILTQPEKGSIVQKYIKTKELSLSHPAYQQLFNALFNDYLIRQSQNIKQKGFILPALKGDFEGWVRQLITDGFGREQAELLAVKSLYDGYYSGKFDKGLLLKGLNEAVATVTFEPLKQLIPGILSKITALREGAKAPALLLKNKNNGTFSLQTKGKFLYLAFFKSDSKESKAELDSLVTLEKKLGTILTILPVSLDENSAGAEKLWSAGKYPWELLEAADRKKASADFQVKTVPAFFLLSPDQKLLLSPALEPSHNFEALFLKIYRESRFRKQ